MEASGCVFTGHLLGAAFGTFRTFLMYEFQLRICIEEYILLTENDLTCGVHVYVCECVSLL